MTWGHIKNPVILFSKTVILFSAIILILNLLANYCGFQDNFLPFVKYNLSFLLFHIMQILFFIWRQNYCIYFFFLNVCKIVIKMHLISVQITQLHNHKIRSCCDLTISKEKIVSVVYPSEDNLSLSIWISDKKTEAALVIYSLAPWNITLPHWLVLKLLLVIFYKFSSEDFSP